MYLSNVMHRGFSGVLFKQFFKMCRLEGVAYDLEGKKGTSFIFLASINKSFLGLLTMGGSRREVVKLMNEAIEFMIRYGGKAN